MADIHLARCRREVVFRFPDAAGDLTPFYISTAQRTGDFHVRRSARPDNSSLALVTAGRGWFASSGAPVALAPGMVYVSSAGSPMEVRCDPREPLTVRLLAIRGPGFPQLLTQELGARDGAWRIGNPDECLRLLDLLRDEARAAKPHAAGIAVALVRALVLTVRRGLASAATAHGSHTTYLRARNELMRESNGPVRLAAVAARLRITPMHLNRVFRAHAGTTPAAWQRNHRLDLAAERLCNSDAAIGRIAAELGWNDPYAFSRAFRRRHGAPPSHWRRLGAPA